jgi:asparagine N-glycosylation enzyme membrane subunit Stt3
MTAVKINENNIFTLLIRGSCVALVVLTITCFILGSLKFAASILIGGLLAIANFFWLRNILQRTLLLQPQTASRFAVVRYIVRLTLLGVVLFLLITYFDIDIFGLLLGLSVLVITIIALSLYYMSTLKGG